MSTINGEIYSIKNILCPFNPIQELLAQNLESPIKMHQSSKGFNYYHSF